MGPAQSEDETSNPKLLLAKSAEDDYNMASRVEEQYADSETAFVEQKGS